MRLLPDGFDTIDELYTLDHLGQLVVAVEASPTLLGRLCDLEIIASAVELSPNLGDGRSQAAARAGNASK